MVLTPIRSNGTHWIHQNDAIGLLALVLAIRAAAGPLYDITDLGTLGGATAEALALSENGQVAGMATTLFGNMHAIDFSASGNVDLTLNSGAWQGIATGVNDYGQISGTQYIGGQTFATIWENGAAELIAGAGSYAQAINSQGDVAGLLTASNGQGHAFITRNGTIVDLGTVPGSSWTSAYAINNGRDVAGYGNIGAAMTAFLWSPSTGYAVLGTLGGANSYALAINDSGAAASRKPPRARCTRDLERRIDPRSRNSGRRQQLRLRPQQFGGSGGILVPQQRTDARVFI